MKIKILLILSLIISTSLSAFSQVINLNAPQGTYYLTDKEGQKFKLVIKPVIISNEWFTGGKVELTLLGDKPETYYGTWRNELSGSWFRNKELYLSVELTESSNFHLKQPRGWWAHAHLNPDYCIDSFVIGDDGWVYPNFNEWRIESPKYRVKLKTEII